MSGPKVTVLISGSGSNLQALLDAQRQGKLPVEFVRVISSSAKAYGLTRAAQHDIPATVHSLYKYNAGIEKEQTAERAAARRRFEEDLASLVLQDGPDLVVCAGWLLILGPTFLQRVRGVPIINLHPALPGAFDGTTHAIELAWNKCQQDGAPLRAGCMVHYVIEQVDKGTPLVVKELEIVPGAETLDEYEQRVHRTEHVAIVEGVAAALRAQGKL
ncbi:AAR120Cp [Eremothecium gossypii ATCC 10895]|uniref:Phosphoribosylglycinamide formyltransferase n=1 Tax=Eremothecium gossypii (strain ATCC 10895 / CBS 109.51 / FGSC 9923 / NRRL Y-1056) TaxID=284811 RepID=Q75EG1_EREGS|nr:AAR120Cp [Eremothecium gossypii ATCC 10895]AAS50486.2 AAR120Cp [Eremothecium gossypii ATCC 10895]AEY94773.1 FAAR120Cp [Eremothecium gossypii FDAG1]